jgi:hypothetical protein
MKQTYFQFPLMLIRKMHTNPSEATQDILRFALVDFALKQVITPEDAARQLLYNFLRGGGLCDAKKILANKDHKDYVCWEL